MSMNASATWTVVLGKTAAKQLDRFPSHAAAAIRAALKGLARDPLDRRANPHVAQLHEYGYDWRLRVRDYRVLYNLDPMQRLIFVGDIARRSRTTYKRRR